MKGVIALALLLLGATAVSASWFHSFVGDSINDVGDVCKPVCTIPNGPNNLPDCSNPTCAAAVCGGSSAGSANNSAREEAKFLCLIEQEKWYYSYNDFENEACADPNEYNGDCGRQWSVARNNTAPLALPQNNADTFGRRQLKFSWPPSQVGNDATIAFTKGRFTGSLPSYQNKLQIRSQVTNPDIKQFRMFQSRYVYNSGESAVSDGQGNLTISFNPPVDGFSFFLRDVSTAAVAGTAGATYIVNIQAINGNNQIFTLATDVISNDADGRAGDILFVSARHDSCDPSQRAQAITFSNIKPEDHFSIDDLVIATNGAKCNPGSISGHVWADGNQNGIRETALEAGIGGVTIKLFKFDPTSESDPCSGTPFMSTTTSSTGHYEFLNLPMFTDASGVHAQRYTICQDQSTVPSSFRDGQDVLGTINHGAFPAGNGIMDHVDTPTYQDRFYNVYFGTLEDQKIGVNYDFGEIPRDPCVGNVPSCYREATVGNPFSVQIQEPDLGGAQIGFSAEPCDPNNEL